MKRTLKLLEKAKVYESYIVSQIKGRSSLYPDDLIQIRKNAKRLFIELRASSFPLESSTQQIPYRTKVEVALFEDMLHKLALKHQFIPMETDQNQRYYSR